MEKVTTIATLHFSSSATQDDDFLASEHSVLLSDGGCAVKRILSVYVPFDCVNWTPKSSRRSSSSQAGLDPFQWI
jgi:hypothetical protein